MKTNQKYEGTWIIRMRNNRQTDPEIDIAEIDNNKRELLYGNSTNLNLKFRNTTNKIGIYYPNGGENGDSWIYHVGFKPTPDEIGAVPMSDNGIALAAGKSITIGSRNMVTATEGTTEVGNTASTLVLKSNSNVLKYFANDNSQATIYSTLNKPTLSELGAMPQATTTNNTYWTKDYLSGLDNGIYSTNGGVEGIDEAGALNYYTLHVASHGGDKSYYLHRLTNNEIYFGTYSTNGIFGGWYKTVTSGNVTSASGFNLATKTEVEGKLDKVTSTASTGRAYVVTSSGAQEMWNIASGAAADTIVFRTGTGAISIAAPTEDTHATPKSYVDTELAKKLDIGTNPYAPAPAVYCITQNNEPYVTPMATAAQANTMVVRNDNASITAGEPVNPEHVTTKNYVDTALSKKLDIGTNPYAPAYVVYGLSADNEPYFIKFGSNVAADMIVSRTNSGAISVPAPEGDSDATSKQYVDNLVNGKVSKSGDTITGNLTITGDLTVNGTTVTENHDTLNVANSYVLVNSDGAHTANLCGLVIKTGDTDNYGIVYDPDDKAVKLGVGTIGSDELFTFNSGEGKPLVIRSTDTVYGDGDILVWDKNINGLKSSNYTMDMIEAAASVLEESLQNIIITKLPIASNSSAYDQVYAVTKGSSTQKMLNVEADGQTSGTLVQRKDGGYIQCSVNDAPTNGIGIAGQNGKLVTNINYLYQAAYTKNVVARIEGSDKDLNEYNTPGMYSAKIGIVNGLPEDATVMVLPWDDWGYNYQIAVTDSGNIYARHRNEDRDPSGTVEIKYTSWNKMYSQVSPPTASDVGAIPISGGTVTGLLTLQNGLTVSGGGIACSTKVTAPNIEVTGGYYFNNNGISSVILSKMTSPTTMILLGNATMPGAIQSNSATFPVRLANGTMYSVYTTGYKPTPADIGAMPTTGGTMTGSLTVQNAVTATGSVNTQTQYRLNTNIICEYTDPNLVIGNGNMGLQFKCVGAKTPEVLIGADPTPKTLYHSGNLPKASETTFGTAKIYVDNDGYLCIDTE